MFCEYGKQYWYSAHNWSTLQRGLSAIAELLVKGLVVGLKLWVQGNNAIRWPRICYCTLSVSLLSSLFWYGDTTIAYNRLPSNSVIGNSFSGRQIQAQYCTECYPAVFFLGPQFSLVSLTCPCKTTCGWRSLFMRATRPKYRSLLFWISSINSTESMSNSLSIHLAHL